MNRSFSIRRLTTIDELKAVQQLERTVWGMDPIPVHQTLTAAKNGGILLGAFDGDRMIGFSYGFPGFDGERPYLCSHMLGIEPAYRGMGLGKRLKWEQRKVALTMGYRLITWTYDPLEAVNASLNLNTLRAICNTYIENCYGEMNDALNRGLPSDRFQVEWWIDSPHLTTTPVTTLDPDRLVCGWTANADGLPQLPEDVEQTVTKRQNLRDETKPLFVPIPAQFQHIKARDPALALDWRMKTRTVFQSLFAQGYAATGTLRASGEPVHYYVLQKRDQLRLSPDSPSKKEQGDGK